LQRAVLRRQGVDARIERVALGGLGEHRVGGQAGERCEAGDDQAAQRTGVGCEDMTENRSALENVC
jgi:hypothetical protein